jgi:hypothetical protein
MLGGPGSCEKHKARAIVVCMSSIGEQIAVVCGSSLNLERSCSNERDGIWGHGIVGVWGRLGRYRLIGTTCIDK